MQTDAAAFQLIANALQTADMRQSVYANNIANVQTPGYHREEVQFESLLQNALISTANGSGADSTAGSGSVNWAAALGVAPVVTQDTSTKIDNNGNNVDVDAEMSSMAENQIKYESLIQDLQTRIARLRTAINGG